MYKHILVPVLFDEGHDRKASINAAKVLADDGAVITLIHVIEDIPAFVASHIPTDVMDDGRRKLQELLDEAAKAIPGAKTALVKGHAGISILEYAGKHGVDCIVVASHKPGLSNYFLGSTADRIVRHARCAVHVIR